MHRHQRGITMIGWLFLLVPIAICGYAGIRLAPIYLNYGKVVRSMDQLASESKADDSNTLLMLQSGLEKRLDIEGIDFPTIKDFVFRREGQAWVVEVGYEDSAPLISNVSLLATFKKSVRIGKASSE